MIRELVHLLEHQANAPGSWRRAHDLVRRVMTLAASARDPVGAVPERPRCSALVDGGKRSCRAKVAWDYRRNAPASPWCRLHAFERGEQCERDGDLEAPMSWEDERE